MTDKKDKPYFIFRRTHVLPFFIGIGLIVLFFLIYLIIAIATWQLSFYSFFFHNIKRHIFLTILSGFHVGMLGIGIFMVMVSVFNMPIQILCYHNRFEVSLFLQKKIVVEYDKISRINVKMYYLNYEDLFKGYSKKECRVFIENSTYPFYFCYPFKGYFDEIEVRLRKDKEDMSARCVATRENILRILSELRLIYSIRIPYLPEEFIKEEV